MINSICRPAFSNTPSLHQPRTSLFAYDDQPSTDASDQICLIIPPVHLSDQWWLIRNLCGINQSAPIIRSSSPLPPRRKHPGANLAFSGKKRRKKASEFCAPSTGAESGDRLVIGQPWDLVAASDKRVDLHKISGLPDPNFAAAFESGL